MNLQTTDRIFVSCGNFLKATAHTEGDRRFIYLEPTNEQVDAEAQRVPHAVMAEAADYYLKWGNIDIGHKTHPDVVKRLGIENPRQWEIGRPIDVRTEGEIFVKGEIYAGLEKADWWWKTQVDCRPPMPWWPSAGGWSDVDPATNVVTKAVWDNVGLANHPVNKDVPQVTTVTPAVFLKALVGAGGSDSAQLTGGAALRRESLRGANPRERDYCSHSSALVTLMREGRLYLGEEPSREDISAAIKAHFRSRGLSDTEAGSYARRFVNEVGGRVRAASQQAIAA